MTRSIFDPTGGETEHSGNRYMGPQADNISHMPSDIVDGKVSEEEVAEHDMPAAPTPGNDAEDAAGKMEMDPERAQTKP